MKIVCPICFNEYNENPTICSNCGYQYLKHFVNECGNKKLYDKQINDELFSIYKFSKAVFNGKIEYSFDKLYVNEREKDLVQSAYSKRGLAYVDYIVKGKITVADIGILAFEPAVSLILNVNEINREFLDESQVKILFLGKDVEKIDFFQNTQLKYITVDSENKFFSSEDNVLFDKDKTRLIYFCNLNNKEEYTVPPTVKFIERNAFKALKNLKVLHLPKDVVLTDDSIISCDLEVKYYE